MSSDNLLYSQEAESAVLGAVLMDGFSFPRVTLCDADFFLPRHQWIWQAYKTLFDAKQSIDMITVSDVLKGTGKLKDAGGDAYLTHLLTSTNTTYHIETYASIVKKCAIRRAIARVANDMLRRVNDDTEADVMEIYHESVKQLTEVEIPSNRATTKKRIAEFVNEREELWNNPAKENGLSWGISAFDHAFGLIKPRNFGMIVAQAKGGKSLLLAHLMRNWSRMNKRVLMLTFEMIDFEVLERLEGIETGFNFDEARLSNRNEKAWADLNKAWGDIYKYPLVIDDTPATLESIPTKIRQAERELGGKIDIVIVDYPALLTPTEANRRQAYWERMNDISVGLKRLTSSEDVIIVGAGQLNRKGFGAEIPTMDEVGGTVGNVQNPNWIVTLSPTDEENPNLFAVHLLAHRSHPAGRTIQMVRSGLRIGVREG